MKVEYLDDLTDGGRFTQVVSENLIRLYDFDFIEAMAFRELLLKIALGEQKSLNVTEQSFIEAVNCTLTFVIAKTDNGITTSDKLNFNCEMTKQSFSEMIHLIGSFCEPGDEGSGYQWLYELDNPIDLLFSPGGTW